ncbi:MAG: DUF4159 domain-containing protein [Verrucomicrobia bacterium]|nr:DUF4159 domain-containing protein [Verrucomicrobiota bacterium]
MSRSRFALAAGLVTMLAVAYGVAQRRSGLDIRTARDIPTEAEAPPVWTNNPAFKKDTFTFARIRYSDNGRRRWGRNSGAGAWFIDFPDADLNLSWRLSQMTSLKVDPNGVVLDITDPKLFDYPWVYMVEPGGLGLLDEEVPILRRYLLNGGFLMVDDFWGEREWENFASEIKRALPEFEIVDLSLDHPIFHIVFDINETLQIPNVDTGTRSQWSGITWEREDARDVHYRAIFDSKGRMMVMICHNTDLGDGWEREGENEYYFREFSEKRAYPLGINIVFYAMTH